MNTILATTAAILRFGVAGWPRLPGSWSVTCVALYPWDPEYYVKDRDYAHTKKGVDLERTAFFATVVTTILSSLFGAVSGSFYGHGFETFLAENIIRIPEKTVMEYSVIGHLHIMLASIATAMPTPVSERNKPRRTASDSPTSPVDSGHFFVCPILASISRSHHMFNTALPAMARNRPTVSPAIVPM